MESMLRRKKVINYGDNKVYYFLFFFNLLITFYTFIMHNSVFAQLSNGAKILAKYEYEVRTSTLFLQFFAPIYAAISALVFYNYRHSVLNYEIVRVENPKAFLSKRIFIQSLKTAIAIFAGNLIYILLAYFLFENDPNFKIYFLESQIPFDVYRNNLLIHGIFTIFIKSFISVFFMTLIAISISLNTESKSKSFLYPVFYFITISLIIGSLPRTDFWGIPYSKFYSYLFPTFLTAADYRGDITIQGILGVFVLNFAIYLALKNAYFKKRDY